MKITAIDVETTGVSFERDRIIGFGLANNQGMRCRYLYNPQMRNGAYEINRLDDDRLIRCPLIGESLPFISWMLGNALSTGWLVGYNIRNFDIKMLAAEYQRNLQELPLAASMVVDLLPWCRYLLPHLDSHSLESVCAFLGVPYGAHEADGDADSTVMVCEKLFAHGLPEDLPSACMGPPKKSDRKKESDAWTKPLPL